MEAGVETKDNARALLYLAGPIALSQLAQTSMGLVDTLMVGRLGAVPLAAIAIGATIHFTILLFGLGMVLAVGPLASQAHGAGLSRDVARYTRQGLWLATILAPIGMAIEYSAGAWFPLLNQDPEVAALAVEYLRALAWSIWPFLLFAALRSWLESVGKPIPVTVIALSAVAVNIAGNSAFVYGRFGAPELGAIGVGYATTISFVYLVIALFVYAQSRSALRAYRVFDRWRWPHPTYLKELVRVGAPMGMSFAIESGFFTATGILVGTLGAVPLAAHQIALQLVSFSFMLPLSVALAITIRVGNLIGAERPDTARHAGWLAIAIGTAIMALSAVLYVLVPHSLVSLFMGGAPSSESQAVGAVAVQLLVLAGVFQVFDGAQTVANGALRGLKDTFWPMVIGLVSYWAIGLSSGYYLMQTRGAQGLWLGVVIGLVFAATALIWRWRRMSARVVRVAAPTVR